MPARLDSDQVAFFHDQGYLLYQQPVFASDTFQALRNHFETLLERWTEDGKRPESMDKPHLQDPQLLDWLLDDAVLDIVEPLLGPDIALFSSHFICKPPGTGQRVPWHEDSAYWGQRIDPMEVITIWLAIDPAVPENGCMQVIPGTHRDGYSQYDAVSDRDGSVFATEIQSGSFDESQAVSCILEPNQCSLHHAKMIHGSDANHSDIRRCGYTMRFMPTTSRFTQPADDPDFLPVLARGQDRAGNRYWDGSLATG